MSWIFRKTFRLLVRISLPLSYRRLVGLGSWDTETLYTARIWMSMHMCGICASLKVTNSWQEKVTGQKLAHYRVLCFVSSVAFASSDRRAGIDFSRFDTNIIAFHTLIILFPLQTSLPGKETELRYLEICVQGTLTCRISVICFFENPTKIAISVQML